jgi:hypothetical protein
MLIRRRTHERWEGWFAKVRLQIILKSAFANHSLTSHEFCTSPIPPYKSSLGSTSCCSDWSFRSLHGGVGFHIVFLGTLIIHSFLSHLSIHISTLIFIYISTLLMHYKLHHRKKPQQPNLSFATKRSTAIQSWRFKEKFTPPANRDVSCGIQSEFSFLSKDSNLVN